MKVSCEADSIELGDIPDNGDLDREVDSCQVASLAQNSLFEVEVWHYLEFDII